MFSKPSKNIFPVTAELVPSIVPLMASYLQFYDVKKTNRRSIQDFCERLIEQPESGCQFVYMEEGEALAFATVYFSFATTQLAKVAVMNDLYTVPEARKKGIAKRLIKHCRAYAKEKGAVRLQWVTAPDNKNAQRVYDNLPVNKSTWEFYTYPV